MTVYVPRQAKVPLTEEQIKGLLKRFDKDGDGRLSKKDLKQAFRSLGLRFSGFRARRALRHADADGDGFISDDEMRELVTFASRWGFTMN